jgi:hypothetical protein
MNEEKLSRSSKHSRSFHVVVEVAEKYSTGTPLLDNENIMEIREL